MRISLFVFLFLSIIACTKEEDVTLKSEEFLAGNWSKIEYGDSTFTVEKVSALPENEYGFSFVADQSFIERKNSGWCGTPPIMYDDFDGTWEMQDSVINISVAYWGGTAEYKWKILSQTDDKLTIWIMNADYIMQE